MNEHFTKHKIPWAVRGLIAFIDARGEVSFDELEERHSGGGHGTRHLIKQAKKLGLVEIPRVRDPETKRFVESAYRLTEKAKQELVEVTQPAKTRRRPQAA